MLQIEQRMLLFFQNLIFVPYINTAKNLKRKKKKKFFACCIIPRICVRICDSNRIIGGCWGASNFRISRPVRNVVTPAYKHILAYRVYP